MSFTIFIPNVLINFTIFLFIVVLIVLSFILLLFIFSFLPRLILRHFRIWQIMWVNWNIHMDRGIREYGMTEISRLLDAYLSDKPEWSGAFERIIKEYKNK